jgi:hypothetical protein
MIGIATTFFWVFLIAFFITAVYSVKDVSFNFGEPQMSQNSSGEPVFSLPVSVTNGGFYDIGAFTITTEVFDQGLSIVRGSTMVPVIRKYDSAVVTHNMTIDVNSLIQADDNYLFNDTELQLSAAVGMHIADMIPVEASTNMTVPWGAPLYNFALGTPSYTSYNATHLRVTVPFSFENHAFFDLIGTIRIRMYNSTDIRVGRGQTNISAYANSLYSGSVDFYVSISGMTPSGRFRVYFSTSVLDYGPLVIPYG